MNQHDVRQLTEKRAVEQALQAVQRQAPVMEAVGQGLVSSLGDEDLFGQYNEDGEFERYFIAGDPVGVYGHKP